MSDAGVHVVTTTRVDGDFAIDAEPAALERRRRAVVDLPWVWLRQVHGAHVEIVGPEDPASSMVAVRGRDGDGLATRATGVALAVQSADCVPVALWSEDGVIAVAHAGWRGLQAGVVEATAAAVRRLGAGPVHAVIGPHLGVGHNEFGAEDLDGLVDRFGAAVRGTTVAGRPALDIDAVLARVVERAELHVERWDRRCTATDASQWFSHRARREVERMATVIWRDPA